VTPHTKRLIAALHLPALPGSPGWHQAGCPPLAQLAVQACAEARAFASAGFEELIIENFGDAPFYPERVPPETIAAMTFIGREVAVSADLTLSVNVLRNDARAALAIATALGASAIRVNVLSGLTATDQGLLSGCAHELLRDRARLSGGRPLAILADVHVKHGRCLDQPNLALATTDLVERAGADAIIVSGSATGHAPSSEQLEAARAAIQGSSKPDTPLLIGSGLCSANARELWPRADGAIIASAALRGGRAGAPVDPQRARALLRELRSL
jgi:uncharacterized protein